MTKNDAQTRKGSGEDSRDQFYQVIIECETETLSNSAGHQSGCYGDLSTHTNPQSRAGVGLLLHPAQSGFCTEQVITEHLLSGLGNKASLFIPPSLPTLIWKTFLVLKILRNKALCFSLPQNKGKTPP